MIKRAFVQPTSEEIKERKKMYREAASLGIDLMEYDEGKLIRRWSGALPQRSLARSRAWRGRTPCRENKETKFVLKVL